MTCTKTLVIGALLLLGTVRPAIAQTSEPQPVEPQLGSETEIES